MFHLLTFIENCQDDYVLFESASTLKEAVVREWNFLPKQDLDNLCTFLLSYVTHQKTYVAEFFNFFLHFGAIKDSCL